MLPIFTYKADSEETLKSTPSNLWWKQSINQTHHATRSTLRRLKNGIS